MVSRVLLPDPLAPMTATSAPPSTERSTSCSAWTSVGTLAVDLRDASQFEHSSSPHLLLSVAASASGSDLGSAGSNAARFSRPSAASSHRMTRVQPEQLGVDHEGEAEVELGLVLFQAGPLLHQLDQVAAVDLDHLVHVDAGHPQRHQHLDDQLVAGGELRSGGVRSHSRQLVARRRR